MLFVSNSVTVNVHVNPRCCFYLVDQSLIPVAMSNSSLISDICAEVSQVTNELSTEDKAHDVIVFHCIVTRTDESRTGIAMCMGKARQHEYIVADLSFTLEEC